MTIAISRGKILSLFRPAVKIATLFFVTLQANAQEVIFRQVADTKTNSYVEATALFSSPSLGGFHPVRVVISNNQKIPQSVFLDFKDSSDYQDELSTSSEFSILAEPGKTVTYDLLVPLGANNGKAPYQTFKAELSGSMGKANSNEQIKFSTDQPCVLLSNTLHATNGSALDAALKKKSRSSGNSEFSSRFDPKRLPDDWRAYSGFDSIILTDNDWLAAPPGARNAIIAWLELGGQLVINSQSNISSSALGIPEETSFGKVIIKSIIDNKLDAKETVNLAYKQRDHDFRSQAISNDFIGHWPLQKQLGEKSFNYIFFILILVAFGIVVGPVNLFVFAKSGRRHRLFITTPIISLITSVILIALIILQDGFGGKGERLVLMEVRPDAGQNAAFIHQEQISRTGVMTSPSFSMDSSAFIAPVPIKSSRWARFTDTYGARGNYDLQPSGGKLHASGSWFQSRSEQGQLISALVPTRGRIEPTNKADTLVSSFDFPIKKLLYQDPSGNWYRAENLYKGKPATLTKIDPTMALPIINELGGKFTKRNKSFFNKIKNRKDHFIAFTTEAPAIETHPSINWETETVITGPIAR